MNEDLSTNLRHWDELAALHERSDYYDVDGFKRGRSSLRSIELEQLGDVSGKRILHLQCHIGLDTLSLARLGADVTGVDFSSSSIDIASSLASELNIAARFVQSDIYVLPSILDEEFDVVFTSYGVLFWLPDLARWADLIARYLRPGGTFCIVDVHPVLRTLAERDGRIVVDRGAYFDDRPDRREAQSYAEPDAALEHPARVHWMHGLGDVVTDLVRTGLRIDSLREYPVLSYRLFPSMVQDEDGWWRLPQGDVVPLLFSLRATRPG
jgi:SAM-dependent methyltransferase